MVREADQGRLLAQSRYLAYDWNLLRSIPRFDCGHENIDDSARDRYDLDGLAFNRT